MIKKYRKKPVIIDAVIWDGNNVKEIIDFCEGNAVYEGCEDPVMTITTLESNAAHNTVHTATVGDYVLKGVKGEFYFCKPEIFKLTYEEVEAAC